MVDKKYDVGILGSLCENDVLLADRLALLGINCLVLRASAAHKSTGVESTPLAHFDKSQIQTFSTPAQLIKKLFACRLLISFTNDFVYKAKYLYPARFLPGFPKVINWNTGSDITEYINTSGLWPSLYRFQLRTAHLNVVSNQPRAVDNLVKYNIPNSIFPPGLYTPEPSPAPNTNDGPIRIFHPARQDWGHNCNGAVRHSMKNNEVFLKGFIRAVNDGLDARCTLLERGADIDAAKDLIEKTGTADAFCWKKGMSRGELYTEIERSDMVIDQFYVGVLGGIGFEAINKGRALMTYFNDKTGSLRYGGNLPPLLNCRTEQDVYDTLMTRCRERQDLVHIGRDLHAWFKIVNDEQLSMSELLFHFSRLTGKLYLAT